MPFSFAGQQLQEGCHDGKLWWACGSPDDLGLWEVTFERCDLSFIADNGGVLHKQETLEAWNIVFYGTLHFSVTDKVVGVIHGSWCHSLQESIDEMLMAATKLNAL